MSFVIADRVKETSTSTGTGNFTLSGAISGHKSFSSRCAINDRCYYCIQVVDANGVPSGAWETGVGVYSATGVLTRSQVCESSNGDELVSFAAGTKHVFITIPAAHYQTSGEVLKTGFLNLYVRKDGSDENSGLSNTAGGAVLTIQRALDIANDVGVGSVTISVGDGTYAEAMYFPLAKAGRYINVVGNSVTPSNVVITSDGDLAVMMRGNDYLTDVKVVSTFSDAICVGSADEPGYGVSGLGNIVYGGAVDSHIRVVNEASVALNGQATISASAAAFLKVEGRSRAAIETASIVLTGTPAFSEAFVVLKEMSMARVPTTDVQTLVITGSATGKRYDVQHGSVFLALQTLTLPGNSAGTTATGGQYATA